MDLRASWLILSLVAALDCQRPPPPREDMSVLDGPARDLRSGGRDLSVRDAAMADAAPIDLSTGGGAPLDLGDGVCSIEHSCKSGMCYAPGEFMGCGACRPPPKDTCTSDADCKPLGTSYICSSDPRDCFCSAVAICRPGCAGPADCDATWQVCGGDNRCTGMPCGGPGSCPANYDCVAARCAPRACTSSADCTGYCVNGLCYASAGHCGFPPP
jgi:hypothetical protein